MFEKRTVKSKQTYIYFEIKVFLIFMFIKVVVKHNFHNCTLKFEIVIKKKRLSVAMF